MCTIMFEPETFRAQITSREDARKQVDELIQQEQEAIAEFRAEQHDGQAMPPIPAGNIFVWFDCACYGNGAPGFYYVRYHSLNGEHTTAYDTPYLIVKKSKLRPDQVAFMERKCRETEEERRQFRQREEERKQKAAESLRKAITAWGGKPAKETVP